MKMYRTVKGIGTVTLLGLVLAAGGCMGHGQHTQEGKDLAQTRMDQLKAGTQLQMAQQQFQAGDLDKARKSVETALAAVPNYAQAHLLRGRIQMEQGDLEGARQSFITAEAIEPTLADTQYYAGICYERFRQWQPAYERYTRAADMDRANPQYVVAAAEMLVHLKQPEQAKALLVERRKDFGHNAAIVQSLGNLAILEGDAEAAVVHYQDARMLAPDDLFILESLARAQLHANQFADAEYNTSKLLDSIASAEPKATANLKARVAQKPVLSRRDLILLRARCLVGLQRFGEAKQIYVEQAMLPEGQRDVVTWVQLGQVAAKTDDAVRLRQVAAKLLSISPDRHEGHSFRALALLIQGDVAAAEQAALAAAKLAPNEVDPLLLISSIMLRQGKNGEALVAAEAAARLDPSNATAARLLQSLSATAAASAE